MLLPYINYDNGCCNPFLYPVRLGDIPMSARLAGGNLAERKATNQGGKVTLCELDNDHS